MTTASPVVLHDAPVNHTPLSQALGYSPRVQALQEKYRRFVDEVCIPREDATLLHDIERQDALMAELRVQASERGLYGPMIPVELGGLGLNLRDGSAILEELGRSHLGPSAVHSGAPDETNIAMLNRLANEDQRQRYLLPLAQARLRSCFAMTEPAPGAGSDPSMMRTHAAKTKGGWVINGHKWFTSGALGAQFAIVMAGTDDGPTMFLVDADNPGYQVVRDIACLSATLSSHCEVTFTDCFVGDDAVLGEVGRGFHYAQVRLEPARITHCMRYIGMARRAMEIAQSYVTTRQSFGNTLADNQLVQSLIADSHIDLHAARLMTWHVCAQVDLGEAVKHQSAITKVFVSEAVNRVVDRAVQLCGAYGIAEESQLALMYRNVREFRIIDGASEVHRVAIAKRVLKQNLAP